MAKGDFVGEFELYVMLALAHLEDDVYGVTIRREIEARTGRTVAIGAVYATLARLEEKGIGAGSACPIRSRYKADAPEKTRPHRSRGSGAPAFDRDARAHDVGTVAGVTGRPVVSKRGAPSPPRLAQALARMLRGREPRLSRRRPGGGIRRAGRDRRRRGGAPVVLEAGMSVGAARSYGTRVTHSDLIAE